MSQAGNGDTDEEIDIAMRAFGKWFIARFKEATFIDFAQVVLSVFVLGVGAFAARVYYRQLQEMTRTNGLTQQEIGRAHV